jgi:hypothetical protein
MVAGVLYDAAGQPVPDTVNSVAVFASMRTLTVDEPKFAVMDLAPSIVTLNGFTVPVAEPLQPLNCDPLCGVAVNCSVDPAA